MSIKWKILGLVMAISCEVHAANYCLAIRGNGELEPAHWGAAANVVERLGLPQAQAGGSSASITMMLLDAIATNPIIHAAKSGDQALQAALLIKSLEGFAAVLTNTSQWKDFILLYKHAQTLKDGAWIDQLNRVLASAGQLQTAEAQKLIDANSDLLLKTYATGVDLGLVGPANYAPLFVALNNLKTAGSSDTFAKNLAIAKFYGGELSKAIATFGSFNAQTDANLFFRPGVVDFDRLAIQFGRIGDFYAMQSAGPDEVRAWSAFISSCAPHSYGLSWEELIAKQPECATQINQLVAMHFTPDMKGNFASQSMGVTIPSLASIAVLTGSAHRQALQAKLDYAQALDPNFGASFRIRHPEQVRFGYWGRDEQLSAIAGKPADDEKSQRFMALGRAPWSVILGLSPAEPGLSPLKEFTSNGVALTSAGGWSDLNPSLVLKASGCESVVYLTRRGGDGLFGQGVAKRLLNLEVDWSSIATGSEAEKKASAIRNNNGDPSDTTSLWSRLYNMANPKSSFRQSLAAEDAILCSNWDDHEITEGISLMINDAYTAQYQVSESGKLASEPSLSPRLNRSEMNPAGYPNWAGCF